MLSGGVDLDHSGRHYRLRHAYVMPGPAISRVPIVVGGAGPRVCAAACRYADALSSFGSPADWHRRNASLDRQLGRYGRRPAELRRSAYVFANLSGDPARELALLDNLRRRGTPGNAILSDAGRAVSTLRAYAAAGTDEVVLGLYPPYRAEQLERFTQTVATVLDKHCAQPDHQI